MSDIKKRMASVKAKRFRGVVSLPGESAKSSEAVRGPWYGPSTHS